MSQEGDAITVLPEEDPLVAALPPATDYLTYLTLLEYQLKPANLKTLNKLLSDDDGKLAGEIGWDLMRLVLPMLKDVHQEASDCLQIIARRGNPREIVVRVAEELEKLGRFDEDDADDAKEDEDTDEDQLPTFPGEATRIHLGAMKLDGMPEDEAKKRDENVAEDPVPPIQSPKRPPEQESVIFEALLSTLGAIHPRIKTQYPSRFLATSLPAALGSYRRMPVSIKMTKSFMTCLNKLSGRPRPALPPRTSTAGQGAASAPTRGPTNTAPLPDPEAEAEASTGIIATSQNERAIIKRLLQAVLVEVLDEYLSSLQSHETASMAWTHRSRELHEPRRVVTGKLTERERWRSDGELTDRDALVADFLSLARKLDLDPMKELRSVTGQDDDLPAQPSEDAAEMSEYPTSPAQIPFPTTGLIILAAAMNFTSGDKPKAAEINIVKLYELVTPLSASPVLPSAGVQDALCSLLYQVICQPDMKLASVVSDAEFSKLLPTLIQTFTISPNPQTRDDAHHIATNLLHEHALKAPRIEMIKQTIRCSSHEIPLAPPYSEGTLKAVGVDWLKDEILLHAKQPSSGINPAVLETDSDFQDLVIPKIPRLLSRTEVDPDTTTSVLLSLPFYISLLNLSCILFSRMPLSALPKTSDNLKLVSADLTNWKEYLVDQMSKDDAVRDSGADIFALDDACMRAKATLSKTAQQTGPPNR